jgi:DNA-binding NtrC family response regulator
MKNTIGFIIDDERALADAIAEMLTLNGYSAMAFYSPSATIVALNNIVPDFAITDFMMPEMDGLTLANHIVQKNPECKVIVLTGNPGAMEGRPDQHRFRILRKPLSLFTILAVVRQELGF